MNSVLTYSEQIDILKCIKRLIYSKDVITQEDKEVIGFINKKLEGDRQC